MTHFSRKKYREIVSDCFDAKPAIFWRDFLSAYALFIASLAVLLFGEAVWVRIAGYIVGAVMAYRCASYIHEIVHLSKVKFGSFITGWNILIGIPFLMPSILYESHLDHHIPRKYGTKDDPEYLPLAGCSWLVILGFLGHHAFVTPLTLYLRMLVGFPVRLISGKASDYLDRRFSSLVINWQYDRQTGIKKKLLALLEMYVFAVTVVGAWLVLTGILAPHIIPMLLSVILTSLVLNGIRTLAAHRYANKTLIAVNTEEQLVDSLNYDGPRWIGGLMAPVGLRFHALHHLFPSIPYHSLEKAHLALIAKLDRDDIYRQTSFSSFRSQLTNLTKDNVTLQERTVG